MKKIALLGSTGSIGKQTLNVVRRHSDKFEIVSLAAGTNGGDFLEQVKEFKPLVATLSREIEFDKSQYEGTEFFFGENTSNSTLLSSGQGFHKWPGGHP